MSRLNFGLVPRLFGPHVRLAAAMLALLGIVAATVPTAQTNLEPEEFTAFAVNMGMFTSGSTATLIMTVNRWTSDAERDKMFAVLRAKGPEGFLDALQDARRVGYLRTPSSVGYELRLALQEPIKGGGRRVLLATDRPISFLEANYRPRTIDYPFTVIDMNIPPEGNGEGTMSVAARIVPAGNTVIVENFDTQPVRLNRIESKKLKKR